MAYDLALGQTSRDWSCGESAVLARAREARVVGVGVTGPQSPKGDPKPALETAADANPVELAETVRSEIARNASLAIRLKKAKRLPEAEFATYRKFHTAWIDYWDFHKGRFRAQDNLNLWNLRELNKQFAKRFKILDDLAKTPIKRPAAPGTPLETTTEIALPSRSVTGYPWMVLLGAGLTIGTLAWFGRQKTGRPV